MAIVRAQLAAFRSRTERLELSCDFGAREVAGGLLLNRPPFATVT